MEGICVSKSIGLTNSWKEIYHFLLCFTLYLRAISKYKSLGPYIRRGNFTEGFLCYEFGGLIFGGADTWRVLFSEFYSV